MTEQTNPRAKQWDDPESRIQRIRNIRQWINDAGGNATLAGAIVIDDSFVAQWPVIGQEPLREWEKELLADKGRMWSNDQPSTPNDQLPYRVRRDGSTMARFVSEDDAVGFLQSQLHNTPIGTKWEVTYDA